MLKLIAKSEKITTGCHLNVRVSGNVDAVRTSVGRSPSKFIQRCSQERIVAILNMFLNECK